MFCNHCRWFSKAATGFNPWKILIIYMTLINGDMIVYALHFPRLLDESTAKDVNTYYIGLMIDSQQQNEAVSTHITGY